MPASAESHPLVSIIIPTFNRTNYLQQALQSAVEQTYKNIEIIITDNASGPDAFSEIRRTVSAFSDPRIQLKQNPVNLGMLRNNLNAFRSCKGKYFANLHDDDVWDPRFLEKLIPPLEADDGLSLAFCDHYIIDEHGQKDLGFTAFNTSTWRREGLQEGKFRPFYELALLWQAIPAAMGSVFRKSAMDLEYFPDETGHAYDLWLAYLACRNGLGAYYCAERLTEYRVHSASATATRLVNLHEGLAFCYGTFSEDPRLSRYEKTLRRRSSMYHAATVAQLLQMGNRERAWTHAKRGFKRKVTLQSLAGYVLGLLPLKLSQKILSVRKEIPS